MSERGTPLDAENRQTRREVAGLIFLSTPHMLRHACGYAAGHGHPPSGLPRTQNIQYTVRYTESPGRFDGC